MTRQGIAFGLGLLLAGPVVAQTTVNVAFDASASGLTTLERANLTSHLQESGRRWSAAMGLRGARSIEVTVLIDSTTPTASAMSVTTAFVGTAGGRQLFEQGVGYELRTGTDPNGTSGDAIITIGINYLRNEMWFDPDPGTRSATVPANLTDAMSVCLHEFGHMILYNGWSDITTGQPPATYWSTFDRWMQPGAPTRFLGAAATQSWGSAPDVTTGNNKHWGNPVAGISSLPPVPWQPARSTIWRDGVPLPLPVEGVPPSADAPADLADAQQPSAGLIDELMNGIVFYRGRRYDISPLDRATLLDVGLLAPLIFASGFDTP